MLLLAGLAPVPSAGAGGELEQIRTVYLLPMGNGLDQYLANQLTRQGVYEVVTDPRNADALFTDQLGARFERLWDELYPPPEPEEPETTEEGEAKEKDEKVKKEEQPAYMLSSFGRGKGNVFLVSRTSRNVLWSIFNPPSATTSKKLNATAEKVVRELRKSLAPAK